MKTRSQDWTKEQVALLVAMYPTRSMKDIAEATGRNPKRIEQLQKDVAKWEHALLILRLNA